MKIDIKDIDLSDAVWHKSTRSGPYSDNCVEVAFVGGAIIVRDSRNPAGPQLCVHARGVGRVRRGRQGRRVRPLIGRTTYCGSAVKSLPSSRSHIVRWDSYMGPAWGGRQVAPAEVAPKPGPSPRQAHGVTPHSPPHPPKIELHVHLEGTIRPATLLEIARRNGERLPADTVEGVRALYEYTNFAHFIDVWILTTNCLRTRDDFRQVVVDYAAEAASFGAVYIEGIFSPGERIKRGVRWDDIFGGYADGAVEALRGTG